MRGQGTGRKGHEIQASAAEHGEWGWVGVRTASHRLLVQLLPIPPSWDGQAISEFRGGAEVPSGPPAAL